MTYSRFLLHFRIFFIALSCHSEGAFRTEKKGGIFIQSIDFYAKSEVYDLPITLAFDC